MGSVRSSFIEFRRKSFCNVLSLIMYPLEVDEKNAWSKLVKSKYTEYSKNYSPKNKCVTFLVYAGINQAGHFEDPYTNRFAKNMQASYANAFQIHQRPFRTSNIHKYFIARLPYVLYLFLIATPIDIVVHTSQFFIGENWTLFEGGFFYIPYQMMHFNLTIVSLLAKVLVNFNSTWESYFNVVKSLLLINEWFYKMSTRKMGILQRLTETALFFGVSYGLILVWKSPQYYLMNEVNDRNSTTIWL